MTPFDIAKLHGNEDICDLLKNNYNSQTVKEVTEVCVHVSMVECICPYCMYVQWLICQNCGFAYYTDVYECSICGMFIVFKVEYLLSMS